MIRAGTVLSVGIFAAILAVPACSLTNTSFVPLDVRFHLHDHEPFEFTLRSREPVYLEYVLTVHAGADLRPTAIVELNGVKAAQVEIERLYAPNQRRVLLRLAVVQAGTNRLAVAFSPPDVAFDLDGRLHNYYGIAPDFPRIAVVSDETATNAAQRRSILAAAFRFAVFLAGSFALVFGADRILGGRRSAAGRALLLSSPAIVPWIALAYSLFTPLHIWLSLEALAVSVLAGLGVGGFVLWVASHRVAVMRAAFVTALSLLALEGALRVFNRIHPTFIFYSDDYNRFRGHPGESFYGTRFNSRGFNDTEHSVVRPAQVTQRIVAIGDSFAVGVVPLRDNFIALLPSQLGTNDSVESINLGVAATEPRDYLGLLVNEGLAYRPDIVLVGLFVGNDFEQTERKPFEYSYVTTLGRALWLLSRSTHLPVTATGESSAVYTDDEPSLDRNRFMEIEAGRAWVYEKDSAAFDNAAARVVETLQAMHDVANRGGAELIVVVIPDEAQVNPSLKEEVAHSTVRPLEFSLPNATVTRALMDRGIRVLDLLPAFQQAGSQTRLYKPQDTHWNIAGNRLAAETIAKYLKTLK